MEHHMEERNGQINVETWVRSCFDNCIRTDFTGLGGVAGP